MQHHQAPERPTLRSRVSSLWQDVSGVWNQFWFKPADPSLIGLIRILTGSMLVYTHIVWGLDFDSFLGPEGWNGREIVEEYLRDTWAPSFWWYVPPQWSSVVHWLCISVLVLFTVGLWSRVTAVLSMAIVVSYSYRAILSNYGLDQINAILMFYLCIGPSGAALSVDRWWRNRRKRPSEISPPRRQASANLALRLIQIHFCVIYFYAGLSKLQGDAWWNGEAVWMALANYEYQTLDMTWIAWYPWVSDLMTHTTIIWEVFFVALVWTRLRPLVLIIGAAVHIGIGGAMGMWTFGLIMIYGHIAFWPQNSVKRIQRWVRQEFTDSTVQRPTGRTPRRVAVGAARKETTPSPANGAARSIVCVDLQGHTRGRFEAYFARHGFVCVTTRSLAETDSIIESMRPESILVSGRGLSDAALAELHESLSQRPAKLVYVLSPAQAEQNQHLAIDPSVHLVYGDTSLGRIRHCLEATNGVDPTPQQAAVTVPESNGKSRSEEWKAKPR